MEKEFTITYEKDGSEIKESYIYNFDKLTMDRIFAAEQLFVLNAEFYQKHNVPGNPEQLTKEMERMTLNKAYKTLLMKKNGNGFVKYNPEDNDFEIFSYLNGKDYTALMEVKDDFFSNSKILSSISVQQSLSLIGELAKEMDGEQFKSMMRTLQENNS